VAARRGDPGESVCGARPSAIQRRADGISAALEHVDIDHGGAHVFVAKQFLHGADVGAILQ